MTTDACGEFLAAVDQLRDDDGTVRLTAHTSSVSADAWSTPATGAESAPAATAEADSAS
ncbi:hypothetical protein [Streptomyces phaeolivaceus]|uniref:hypothetical protein n=1 Tax=Streptomyces phaeolivaceus TaxID=2653200 RepID=UPI001869980C|nr:hypothetical protein [Streptomyces phaeolivaceus]